MGKSGESFIIYTYSVSTLVSLKQLMPRHHLVKEIHDWLSLVHMRKRSKIAFCWVPAHVGIDGNERADLEAKEAVKCTIIINTKIPHGDFKDRIHKYIMNKWQERWDSLTTNQKFKEVKPVVGKWSQDNSSRRSSIILTRLRIGHTHLTDNYRLRSGEERQVPFCNVCRSDITVRHIILDCSVFNRKRRKYSLHGRSISDILGENSPMEILMKFLKEIDVFYKL